MTIATTYSSLANVLRESWDPDKIDQIMLSKRPLLGMINKDPTMGGTGKKLPIRYSHTQGASSTFAVAQATVSASLFKQFALTHVYEYSLGTIAGDAIQAARSGEYSVIVDAAEDAIFSATERFSQRVASALYRSNTGSIGKVAVSGVSTVYLTLDNKWDAINFQVGQTVTESASDGGSVGTGGSTGEILKKIDRANGVLTCTSAAWTTILTGITDGHFLYTLGDAKDGGTAVKITGLQNWLVPSASATTLFGVDCTLDSLLSGSYYDISTSGLPLNEGIIAAVTICHAQCMGSDIDAIFLNDYDFMVLENLLGVKDHYAREVTRKAIKSNGDEAAFGYEGLVLNGPRHPIRVYADPYCPQGVGFGLTLDDWAIYHMSGFPMLDDVGGELKFIYNADGVEFRLKSYLQFGGKAPGASVRMKIS